MKEIDIALGYDDISLLPNFSKIESRKDVNTDTILSKNIKLKIPLISSPMDTVSTINSCVAMNEIGAAGILHRFMTIEEQCKRAKKIKDRSGVSYCAIGIHDFYNRLEALNKVGVDLFFLDSANGLSERIFSLTKWYYNTKTYKQDFIVGNTLTKESVSRLINMGASGVRHLIGPGSACLTTMMTGIGCPSITGIYYAWKALRNWQLYNNDWDNKKENAPSILVDGGCRYPKDLVKAICAGSDAIICGGIFVGCFENSEEIIEKDGKQFVKYRGMASKEVVEDYGLTDGTKQNLFIEGDVMLKPFQNKSIKDICYEFTNGLRSAMSYLNFNNLDDIKGSLWNGKTRYVKITPNSLYEGFAHGNK